jgi:hypothetical protein
MPNVFMDRNLIIPKGYKCGLSCNRWRPPGGGVAEVKFRHPPFRHPSPWAAIPTATLGGRFSGDLVECGLSSSTSELHIHPPPSTASSPPFLHPTSNQGEPPNREILRLFASVTRRTKSAPSSSKKPSNATMAHLIPLTKAQDLPPGPTSPWLTALSLCAQRLERIFSTKSPRQASRCRQSSRRS